MFWVEVKAKAKENRLQKISEGHYQVWVTAEPIKGRANQAVIKLLAAELDLPKSYLYIKSGVASKHKLIALQE